MIKHTDDNHHSNSLNGSQDGSPSDADTVKLGDRSGNVKVLHRLKSESKKRRKKKRFKSKKFVYREALSIAFILVVMLIAVYIALKIVQ